MIQFRCPCGRLLQAREEHAGGEAQCPACGAISTVPSLVDQPSAPQAIRAEVADDESPRRSRRRIDEDDAPPKKSGWSVLLIIGLAVGGLLVCCALPIGLLLPAVSKVREAAARMNESNNFKQFGVAMHNFHAVHNGLPQSAAYRTENLHPGLSWRVAILPYIEEEPLYRQFKLDEPWDSPTNKPLLARMPKVFARPGEAPNPDGLTHYLAVIGKGSAFDDDHETIRKRGPRRPGFQRGLDWVDFKDGTSNTIIAVTAAQPVPWTKPDDFDMHAGPISSRLDKRHNGTVVLFADGSVRTIQEKSEAEWRAYMTIAGGEVIRD